MHCYWFVVFFFFKQKTAYELRISDWSSDVCSSDLALLAPRRRIQAVDGLSLEVRPGENLGIVGESGSGKSTLARLAMALEAPDSGTVSFVGQDLNALSPAALRLARRDFQIDRKSTRLNSSH